MVGATLPSDGTTSAWSRLTVADLVGKARAAAPERAEAEALALHHKFEENTFQLVFADMPTYHAGLEGLVGSPNPNLRLAMQVEHCEAANATKSFTTRNYGLTTTPTIEWHAATVGEKALSQLKLDAYPAETYGLADGQAGRASQIRPLEELLPAMHALNAQLRSLGEEQLLNVEVLAGRLYTGPMFQLYNIVCRASNAKAPQFMRGEFEQACMGNKYTTTLHALNSLIVKSSKMTKVSTVYRGSARGVLPQSFWEPDKTYCARGGVECAFMSTTTSFEVAIGYAGGREATGTPMVMEFAQGMANRGADLSWLSYYPFEAEVLFAPLTCIELKAARTEGNVIALDMQVSVNLTSPTIEKVIAKLQASHLDLLGIFKLEFEAKSVPAVQLEGLKQLLEKAKARDGNWFNDAEHFQEATAAAFAARGEVLRWMVEEARLVKPWPKVLAALGTTLGMPLKQEERPVVASTVWIPAHGFRENDGHTEYRIETQLGDGAPVVVWRRYSDIRTYHETHGLGQAFPVAKKLVHTVAVKEKRCGALERYLREAVRSSCRGGDLAFGSAELRQLLLDGAAASAVPTASEMPVVAKLVEEERVRAGMEVAVTKDNGVNWEHDSTVTVMDGDKITVKTRYGKALEGLPPTKALVVREGGAGALLREAAAAGKEKMVEALLGAGVSPFAADARLNTALHLAAAAGHVRICLLLRDKGADHEVCNAQRQHALGLAVANKHVAVRRLFLPTLSDREFTEEACTATALLRLAARGPVTPAVRWPPTGEEEGDITALMVASRYKQFAVVQSLLETSSTAKIDAQSSKGCTALHLAAEEGDERIVAALLARGASVALVDVEGNSGLMRACEMGHAPCARLLVDKGSDVDAASSDGYTALMAACQNGHADCARLLVDKGCNVDAARSDGVTALMWACGNGHADCARLLVDKGCNVDAAKSNGVTALVWACHNGHADCARLLVDKGCNVDAANFNGRTALMSACQNGHADCARLLVGKGCDVDAANSDGFTALMSACANGHADCARLLVDKGCNVDAADSGGVTALMAACANGHADCARLLVDKGCNVHAATSDGVTALVWACHNGHADCARLLVDKGCNVDAANFNGRTALMLACAKGHADCARLLLGAGANVHKTRPSGHTAIAYAKSDELKQLLRAAGARG